MSADRIDPEDPALAARVRRLEHRGEADLVGCAPPLRQRPQRREPRLRHALLGEPPPHRDLVRHQVGRLDADPRQPACLRDRGDHRHGAVGGHGQHAVDSARPRRPQARRRRPRSRPRTACRPRASPSASGFRSTASDAQPELLRPQDRAPLVAPRADEEDGLHSAAMLLLPPVSLARCSPSAASPAAVRAGSPPCSPLLRPVAGRDRGRPRRTRSTSTVSAPSPSSPTCSSGTRTPNRSSARAPGSPRSCRGDWVFRIDDDEVPSAALLAAARSRPTRGSRMRSSPGAGSGRTAGSPRPLVARLAAAALPRRGASAFRGVMHVPIRASGPARLPRRAALPPRPRREHARAARGEGRGATRRVRPRPPARRPSASTPPSTSPSCARRVRSRRCRPTTQPLVDPVRGRRATAGAAAAGAPASRRGRRSTPTGPMRRSRDSDYRGAPRARPSRRTRSPASFGRSTSWRRTSAPRPGPPATTLPEIRLAYRFEGSDRAGLRTPFPHPVAPGEHASAFPSRSQAPPEPGPHTLVVDLVHERHRWFGCEAAAELAGRAAPPRRRPRRPAARRPAVRRAAWTRRSPPSTRRWSPSSSARSPTGSATASASRPRRSRPPGRPTRSSSSPPAAAGTGFASPSSHVGFGVVLEGKRILITGGAGFIATTLARELVDRNEIVAVDNLHRDALSGTDLAAHPNFELHQADVLDGERLKELAARRHALRPLRRDRRRRDGAREPGADDARERDRHLQRARGCARDRRTTLERFVDFSTSEVFGTHAYNVSEGQVSTIGSVGEARWTYAVSKLAGEHMAHAYHDELQLPTVTVHPFNVFGPAPDRRRRDPRLHRGGARGRGPDRARRRLADPRLVLRHRHGERRPRLPRAARGGRARRSTSATRARR